MPSAPPLLVLRRKPTWRGGLHPLSRTSASRASCLPSRAASSSRSLDLGAHPPAGSAAVAVAAAVVTVGAMAAAAGASAVVVVAVDGVLGVEGAVGDGADRSASLMFAMH